MVDEYHDCDAPSLPAASAELKGNYQIIEEQRAEIERLTKQLVKLQGALGDWLHCAREELSEFDIDEESCDGEALCPRCRNSGCIQLKIRNSHALLTDDLHGEQK